ncbi:MAG: hypothetical protein LBT26_03800 [Clostridiales Family XIII bacterium]|nr:hypothetical protein [Clostridiales Family XIII bacterium]
MFEHSAKRKGCASVICFTMVLFLLGGCGNSRPQDKDNKNYELPAEIEAVEGIDFYYDMGAHMAGYAENTDFYHIVYSAYSTAVDINASANAEKPPVYSIADPGTDISQSFFNGTVNDAQAYGGSGEYALTEALKQVKEEKLAVIITELSDQLHSYADIAQTFKNQVFDKGLELAVIGVNLNTDAENDAGAGVETSAGIQSFFIFVVGINYEVSRFISAFKEKPDIIAYAGKDTELQIDEVRRINYQIMAGRSGIQGIDYQNIRVVENGIYYKAAPEIIPQDVELSDDGRFIKRNETDGSFDEINEEYTKDKTNTVEGSVNIKDTSDAAQRKVLINPQGTGEERNVRNYKYLAVQSLVAQNGLQLAGKIKLEIPFHVIDGVQLSNLDCTVQSSMSMQNGKKFVPYTGNVSEYFQASIAVGVIPEQGKWRVSDANDSIIFNIILPNAGSFPSKSDLYKLDVTLKHFSSKENVAAWVKEWDAGLPDLLNLFYSIYALQEEINSTENSFTIYIERAGGR